MKAGKGANRNPVVSLLRKADTAATERYGIGGRPKANKRPQPSLPKLKCLATDDKAAK